MKLLCTWFDVIEKIPQFIDGSSFELKNINTSLINRYILEEQNKITSLLRPYYADFKTGNIKAYSIASLSNRDGENNINVTNILKDTNFADFYNRVYRFEVLTGNKVKLRSSGNTDYFYETEFEYTDPTLYSDGYIKFAKNSLFFSNTGLGAGDLYCLIISQIDSTISNLIADSAAARVLERTFTSQNVETPVDAREFRITVSQMLDRLTSEVVENLLEVPKITVDLSPRYTGYSVNELGQQVDVSEE